MCGRFTFSIELDIVYDRFEIANVFREEGYIKRYNIAPSQKVLSVINDGQANRLGYLQWGLIPSWSKDPKVGYKMINARAETITEKPSFRTAFKKRRCLILADSFYEWKKEGNQKIPMRIRLKQGELFSMAGLWEKWISPSGEQKFTCTIITTPPNRLMSTIHDRMPAILDQEQEKIWLDPTIEDANMLQSLLQPYAAEEMEAYPVSTAVNSPKNDSPELIHPC